MIKKNNTPQTTRPHLMDLFAPITPYSSGYMDVEGGEQQIYWEQSGNLDGVPILLLHGGPGAGCAPVHRRFFDPDYYRIILFDQRGSGRSNPHGTLDRNTTAHLIADIEQLRDHLSIEKWHVFGGSWGSTLALSYATEHAGRCISLILRGIFLMEEEDINWFLHGIRWIYPEIWENFIGHLPFEERDDILEGYYKRLTDIDPQVRLNAAINWTLYESACSSLIPNYETITTEEQKAHALSLARIEAHYFKTQIISPGDSLLTKIDRFRRVPAVIIHGRYDMICPMASAYKLHNAWPEADYIVVPDGGHSALDPAIRSRLIEATENAKTI